MPTSSKLLEKVVYNQTMQYLEKHNILLSVQSGFRRSHGTGTALIKINDDIITAQDQGMATIMVLLDMSKAFDSVSHDLLIAKLYHHGIRGMTWEWFKEYYHKGNNMSNYKNFLKLLYQAHKKWKGVSHKGQFWDHSCSICS